MNKVLKIFLCLLVISFSQNAISYGQSILKDIYSGNSSSNPEKLVEGDSNEIFFSVQKYVGGIRKNELWKTDGSENGTVRIGDSTNLENYPQLVVNSNVGQEMHFFNGNLYFQAKAFNTNTNSQELWISDGTNENTHVLKDICSGSCGITIGYIGDVNNKLVFLADPASAPSYAEIWASDGTEGGTQFLETLGSQTYQVAMNNDYIFFLSDFTDLWATNGTLGGTKLVFSSTVGLNLLDFKTIDNEVYYVGNDGLNGTELWKTDGDNTSLVKDLTFGSGSSSITHLTEFDGSLFFINYFSSGSSELWKTDGSAVNTLKLTGSYPNVFSHPQNLAVTDNLLFFTATEGTLGRELWATDGTSSNCFLVKDINGFSNGYTNNTFEQFITDRNFYSLGDYIFFTADDGIHGRELWSSNGTSAGTSMLSDFNSGSQDSQIKAYFNHLGNFLFTASDSLNEARLWQSNGSVNGTVLFEPSSNEVFSNYYPLKSVANGDLYLAAFHKDYGYELTKLNNNVLSLVKDIEDYTNPLSNNLDNTLVINNNLFFLYDDGKRGYEYWITDGTENGTNLTQELNPYPADDSKYSTDLVQSWTHVLEEYNGKAYLTTSSPWSLYEYKDKQFSKLFTDHFGHGLSVANNKLWWNSYFSVFNYDGNLISEFPKIDEKFEMNRTGFYGLKDKVIFVSADNSHGVELFSIDTVSSTYEVYKDISFGSDDTKFEAFQLVGDKLYFVINSENGSDLWVTTGVSSETIFLKTIYPPHSLYSIPGRLSLTNYKDSILVFNVYENLYDGELWKTSGTLQSTSQINTSSELGSGCYFRRSDYYNQTFPIYNELILLGPTCENQGFYLSDGDYITLLVDSIGTSIYEVFDSKIFFSKYDMESGTELYVYDIHKDNLKHLDLLPGRKSSSPGKFIKTENSLYFSAFTETGNKIFVINKCSETLAIDGVYDLDSSFEARNSITTDGMTIFEGNKNYMLNAGKYIELNPGLNISVGTVFETLLVGCE
ncbi:hypothetical protein [Arcticibacterium luteifluviistationis]|nr:hypothetical protein [Arcticibacterium luteifluviistationis]